MAVSFCGTHEGPVVIARDQIQIKELKSYTKMNYCPPVTNVLTLGITHHVWLLLILGSLLSQKALCPERKT